MVWTPPGAAEADAHGVWREVRFRLFLLSLVVAFPCFTVATPVCTRIPTIGELVGTITSLFEGFPVTLTW